MKLVAAALFVLVLSGASAGAGAVRPVVVEVYTSQGCNSCLAANTLAGRVAQRPGILLLSFSVTYWDLFGWKDTLGNEDNTRRQKSYAAALRRGGIYTPQMIVDGVKDIPAAREDSVSYALTLAALARDEGASDIVSPVHAAASSGKSVKAPVWSANVSLSKQPNDLRVIVDRAPDVARRAPIDATVWLFRVRSNASVKIGGGENAGQTVAYRNVVTQIASVGHYRGEPLVIAVPKPGPKTSAHDAVAVVVQQGGYGRVVGAAFINNAPFYAPQ